MTAAFAFIQARMSSSRLPGKVLEPLCGLPLIVFMARRVARCALLDGVVILTSTDPSDDALAATVQNASISVFRGELHDVLARYESAAESFRAMEIVRLTGDCPLADPAVIADVIRARRLSGADYCSNVDPPTYPDGFDVECFTREALELASRNARVRSEREHVTVWMRERASGLMRTNVSALADLSKLRLTVDYRDDLEAVRRVTSGLTDPLSADLFDILRVLSHEPELSRMNAHIRNEGLAQSLSEDAADVP